MRWFSQLQGLFKRNPSTRTDMLDLLSDDSLVHELDGDEIAMLRGVLSKCPRRRSGTS